MNYGDYKYLYPPRPESKIPADMLPAYEKRGWWAQLKKNGTNTVIFARGLQVIFKTRHGDADDHRQWSPLPEHIRFFQSANTSWNVYCAELIHSKTPHIKNQLYIYDQIVKDGVHLVGSTFEDRQKMLHETWKGVDQFDQLRVDPYVSVAKNFTSGLKELFKSLKNKEDEGLVLKNPKGILRVCFTPESNRGWQVKCRVPHKNYSF